MNKVCGKYWLIAIIMCCVLFTGCTKTGGVAKIETASELSAVGNAAEDESALGENTADGLGENVTGKQKDIVISGNMPIYKNDGEVGTDEKSSDTEAPVIKVPESVTYSYGESILYKKDVTVTDNNDTPVINVDNSEVDPNTPGTYTVYYSATDFAGNTGEAQMKITILPPQKATKEDTDILAAVILAEIFGDDWNNAVSTMADYDVAWEIFNWCSSKIENSSFGTKDNLLQGAFEGLSYKKGDCYTYYATAKYLMDLCEIENISVSRRADGPTHYWSLVAVDGQFYHFDCSPHLGFTCFLQTDEQTRRWGEERRSNPDYFLPDQMDIPERATVPIYDGNL